MNSQRRTPLLSPLIGFLLLMNSGILFGQAPAPWIGPVKPELVKVKGIVDQVDLSAGLGPGKVILRAEDGKLVKVLLGPVRYLIQKGFNLRVGNEAEASGLQWSQQDVRTIMAAEIKNITEDKSLRLRDEYFRPLWRGGRFGCPWNEQTAPSPPR